MDWSWVLNLAAWLVIFVAGAIADQLALSRSLRRVERRWSRTRGSASRREGPCL